jgi:hypothetical protein
VNRRIGFIGIMFAALTGMGITLFFLSRTPEVSPSSAEEGEEYIYIANSAEVSDAAIASVTVRNSFGEFTLTGGDNPAISGFEHIAMDTYSLGRILNVSVRLVSRGLVTNEAADLAVFGLEPPRAELLIRPAEGEAAALLIGSDAPDGGNVYVKLTASPQIHLAASYDVDLFLKSPLDFTDTEITPQAETSRAGEPPFAKIVLGGLVRRGEEITIVDAGPGGGSGNVFFGSRCRITGPVNAALSTDKGLPPLEALFGLKAARAAALLSANGELARYGLAEPWSTAEVYSNPRFDPETGEDRNGNFSLRVSKPDERGMVHILREGSSLVYEAAASSLPWLELSWFDLMEKLIILPFIDSISLIEIKTPSRAVSFSLSGGGDDLRVKAGDIDIDTGNFRAYYQTLIAARYDEYSGVSAAALPPPFLEIVYHYRGRPADTVSFHEASSRRVLSSLNRGRPHFTLSAYTDQVLADLDAVLANQSVRPYL